MEEKFQNEHVFFFSMNVKQLPIHIATNRQIKSYTHTSIYCMSTTCYGLKAAIYIRMNNSLPKIYFIQVYKMSLIFRNYSVTGVTYLQIRFSKSLRNKEY